MRSLWTLFDTHPHAAITCLGSFLLVPRRLQRLIERCMSVCAQFQRRLPVKSLLHVVLNIIIVDLATTSRQERLVTVRGPQPTMQKMIYVRVCHWKTLISGNMSGHYGATHMVSRLQIPVASPYGLIKEVLSIIQRWLWIVGWYVCVRKRIQRARTHDPSFKWSEVPDLSQGPGCCRQTTAVAY